MLRNSRLQVVALALWLACNGVSAATGEVAQADAQRKKPLQRCDQMNDKAEIDGLKKARERIVEARQKRETASKGEVTPATGKSAAKAGP